MSTQSNQVSSSGNPLNIFSVVLNVVLALTIALLLFFYFREKPDQLQALSLNETSLGTRVKEIEALSNQFATATTQKYKMNISKYADAKTSGPLDDKTAKYYTSLFRGSLLADALKKENAYFESVHFDSTTIANFAMLLNSNKIDGLRVYLAKYPGINSNYTIVMVGTKAEKVLNADGASYIINRDQIIKVGNDVISIQNYGDPCPPPKCQGNDIGN